MRKDSYCCQILFSVSFLLFFEGRHLNFKMISLGFTQFLPKYMPCFSFWLISNLYLTSFQYDWYEDTQNLLWGHLL